MKIENRVGDCCFLTGRTTTMTNQNCARKLSIDHCHKTSILRGLILGWINRSLEFISFQPQSLGLSWTMGSIKGKLGNAAQRFIEGIL